jgi:hypothetical protein
VFDLASQACKQRDGARLCIAVRATDLAMRAIGVEDHAVFFQDVLQRELSFDRRDALVGRAPKRLALGKGKKNAARGHQWGYGWFAARPKQGAENSRNIRWPFPSSQTFIS